MSDPAPTLAFMMIDCKTCPVREVSCADCVITVLLSDPGLETPVVAAPTTVPVSAGDPAGSHSRDAPLDPSEQHAVGLFVAAGLLGQDVAQGLRAVVETPWNSSQRTNGASGASHGPRRDTRGAKVS